jgi:glycosyltransferase involved in cell wall biosynthesis
MTSSGIRSRHLALELSMHFDVTLAAPEPAAVPDVRVVSYREAASSSFDVVVAQSLPPALQRPILRSGARLIFDLYIPVLAEALAAGSLVAKPHRRLLARAGVDAQRLALAWGDAFVCASDRQRDYWLGALAAMDRLTEDVYVRDRTLRHFIDVVPFGVPSNPPQKRSKVLERFASDNDRVLLWAGGIPQWLDPETPIRAMLRLPENVKLVFLAPEPPAPAGAAAGLARELGLIDRRVFFNDGWVPYADRGDWLLSADVGVSAHRDSLEARLSFRTRILDHFWAGLPTVTSTGDVLADLVVERDLGHAAAPADVEGYADAVAEVLRTHTPSERFDAVRRDLAWPRVVEPLVRLASSDDEGPPRRRLVRTEAAALAMRAALSAAARSARMWNRGFE